MFAILRLLLVGLGHVTTSRDDERRCVERKCFGDCCAATWPASRDPTTSRDRREEDDSTRSVAVVVARRGEMSALDESEWTGGCLGRGSTTTTTATTTTRRVLTPHFNALYSSAALLARPHFGILLLSIHSVGTRPTPSVV